ncbi:ABC transporter permease [Terracidiphilus gabretensis]|uniref:ABC transporter permease n=1 Tax=Terracidiphilus gabretensis TaxID=1577687 RepID=UPI00071B0DAB|nr:ABC transporter permease [Terracidiphilus gabretensis]
MRFWARWERKKNDLRAELEAHLRIATEERIARGESPEEARTAAVREMGNSALVADVTRSTWGWQWLEHALQDIRYAVRGFGRNPTFSFTVVLTLMLGIGATTAVFSVVDRILFRNLPYSDSGRLVSVGLTAPIETQEFALGGFYYEWQDNQKPFVSLTSEIATEPCDLTEVNPVRLDCAHVEANFLPTLGVAPIAGRNFLPDEDRPNGPKAALISYALWEKRFQLDRSAVGRVIRIDGHPIQIVGVLPKDFEMPRLQAADILLPQALDVAAERRQSPEHVMWAFARLKPGVSIEQATAELQPLFEYSLRLAPAPFRKEVHLRVRSLRDRQFHDVHRAAWMLLGLVAAVLLIACANVASLLMARGASREKEQAVRAALGASRLRLTRQALTESFILSLAGGIAGCLFAAVLMRLFVSLAPEGLPSLSEARIDLRIFGFTLAVSLACAVFFGLISATRRTGLESLTQRTRLSSSRALLRQCLVTAQIAMSLVLLAGGALLVRSFWNLQTQNLGMNAENIVTAAISLGQTSYPTAESQMAFFQQLQHNLRYGPGIAMLAMSDSLPPGGDHRDQIFAPIHVEGKPQITSGTGGTVAWRWVTSDYFSALQIPIVQGSGFAEEELSSSGNFVVLSKSLANRIFPGQDPVGQQLHLHSGAPDSENPLCTVVGVAADVKNGGLAGGEEPEYYRLRRNHPEDWDHSAVVILKTNLPASVSEQWIRSQVASLDPTLPVDVNTLHEEVGKMADQPRFEMMLVGFFACTGIVLAMVGLYGVVSYLVVQRTAEIGLRMAVGASRADILRLVLRGALSMIVPGILAGIAFAFVMTRMLSSLLFNTGTHDPAVFCGVTVLLALVTLLATFIPARSAMYVNPTVALRSE